MFRGGPHDSHKKKGSTEAYRGETEVLSSSHQLPLTTSSSNFKDVKAIAGFHVFSRISEAGTNMA